MGDRKAELVDEIAQLLTQYRQEVPGKRKAWPESIKNRALELRRLGLSFSEISKQTGISYYTILCWRDKKGPTFERVSVVPAARTATVTVARRPVRELPVKRRKYSKVVRPLKVATVTVALSSDVRIEGVTVEFLKALLPSLTRGLQ